MQLSGIQICLQYFLVPPVRKTSRSQQSNNSNTTWSQSLMYLTADSTVSRYSFQRLQHSVCCWSWLRFPLAIRKYLNLRDFSGFLRYIAAICALLAMLRNVDPLTLEHGAGMLSETSVNNYQCKLHNIPEEGTSPTSICRKFTGSIYKNSVLNNPINI